MKGLPKINSGGSAVGGEVYTILCPKDNANIGVYVAVLGYSLDYMGKDPNKNVSIMLRITTPDDVYGCKENNRWLFPDLTVGELSLIIIGHVSKRLGELKNES
jgi:hypothetical protein